jgi:hypothetical protein
MQEALGGRGALATRGTAPDAGARRRWWEPHAAKSLAPELEKVLLCLKGDEAKR